MSHRIAVYFYLPTRRQISTDVLCALATRNVKPQQRAIYARQKRLYNQLCCEVYTDACIYVKQFPHYNTIIWPTCESQLRGYEYMSQPFRRHPTSELLAPFERGVLNKHYTLKQLEGENQEGRIWAAGGVEEKEEGWSKQLILCLAGAWNCAIFKLQNAEKMDVSGTPCLFIYLFITD